MARGNQAGRKKKATLVVGEQTRPQDEGPDLHYLFAPLKRARLDYMAQKATEMGASLLQPVITRRTVAERVNTDRLLANAIEAAEQCGVLRVPEVGAPATLAEMLAAWDPARLLIFADEQAPSRLALGGARRRKASPARRADRAGGRLRPGGAGAPSRPALCPAHLPRSAGDARRHRGRSRPCHRQRRARRLALKAVVPVPWQLC